MIGNALYLAFGLFVIGGVSWYEYRGYSFAKYQEVRNVPKSVRDNPGAYRSHYSYYPRYVGGK